jgi:hypothetical protein
MAGIDNGEKPKKHVMKRNDTETYLDGSAER